MNKFKKIIIYYINKIYHEFFVFNINDEEQIFTKIYKSNYWGSDVSKSGPGSDLENTKRIRKKIPFILKKYKIKSIFDAPCGDFFWFNRIISNLNIDYIGADVVKTLINNNKKKSINKKIKFIKLNLISSVYPKSDLWICRALFFHLDYKSIFKILHNLKNSNIKYILLTNSYTQKHFKNKDIRQGNYRQLDLFKAPFNFKKNYILKFTDTCFPATSEIDQEMILWKKKDLIKNIKYFK